MRLKLHRKVIPILHSHEEIAYAGYLSPISRKSDFPVIFLP